MERITFKLVGKTPTLQHNGRLANPLDPMSKALKEFSSKKSKTDEVHRAMADIEWLGGLYTTEDFGVDYSVKEPIGVREISGGGKIIWPSDNISRMLRAAATRWKLGKAVNAAVYCLEDPLLEFPGDKMTIAELFKDSRYRFTARVVVGGKSIMRTRPMFPDWKLTVSMDYDRQEIDGDKLVEAMSAAGSYVGLSDHRPRFGRFEVQVI